MVEGLAKHYGRDVLEVYSAGTHSAEGVNPNAIAVLKEIEIDINSTLVKRIFSIALIKNKIYAIFIILLFAKFRKDINRW